jgi:hypothetical protein
MPRIQLLLLLSFFCSFIVAIRFSVQHNDFVQICIGEPCQWKVFRLNRTSSDIWLHDAAYIAASRTYYQSLSGLQDSEVFYFNDVADIYRVRLHMHYFPIPPVLVGKENLAIAGTLGLGPSSELWTIWSNYTLTSKRLELGAYDSWSQRDPSSRPPILVLGEEHQVTLGDGTTALLNFDISTTQSYIPYGTNLTTVFQSISIETQNCTSRYDEIGMSDVGQCDNNIILRPDAFQSITLQNGIDYEAIDYTEGTEMQMGTRFVGDFFWFRSIDANSVIITEDAFFLDYVGVTIGASLAITTLYVFWLVIIDSKEDRKKFYELMFMLCAEALSYFVDFMVMMIAFAMLDWGRYISQYAQESGVFAVILIVATLLTSFTLYVIDLVYWNRDGDHNEIFKKIGLLRTLFFTCTQGFFLWLCLVEQHETTFDRLFIALIITIMSIFQLVAVGLFLAEKAWISMSAAASMFILTTAFHIIYDLLPIFKYGNLRHQVPVACFLWIYFFELVPAFFISLNIKMHQALHHAEQDKLRRKKPVLLTPRPEAE